MQTPGRCADSPILRHYHRSRLLWGFFSLRPQLLGAFAPTQYLSSEIDDFRTGASAVAPQAAQCAFAACLFASRCFANTAGCPSFCPEGQYARGAAMFSLRCEHTPRFFRYYAQLRRSVGVFGDFSAICRRQSACTRTIMKSPSDLTVTGICVDFPSSPATTKLSFAPLGRFRKMYGKSPKRMSEPSAIEVR